MTSQLNAVSREGNPQHSNCESKSGRRCTCSKCAANRGKPLFSVESWTDKKIIDAFEAEIENRERKDEGSSDAKYSITRKDVLSFSNFLLTWTLHRGCRRSSPSNNELALILQNAQHDLHAWMDSHDVIPPLVDRQAMMVRALARHLPISAVREIGRAPTGTAKRLRDLAAGKIEGDIKQFEYSLAADRIEDLEGIIEQLRAQIASSHQTGK